VIDCQVCVLATGKTSAHLKFVFKMSTVCSKSNSSSKTWTPLPDRFIDDHLVEMFPLFDQARLQLVDVTNLATVHMILQLQPHLVVSWVKVRTVGWPQQQCWSDEVWCSRRRLERRWRTTGAEADRSEYRQACRKANQLINASRTTYYRQCINEAGSNYRLRWKIVNDLLHFGRQPRLNE